MERRIKYYLGHGSGNKFVIVDTLCQDLSWVDYRDFAQKASAKFGTDGLLLLIRNEKLGLYGMDMYNPDGTQAQMCGNGIRLIALLSKQYISSNQFDLWTCGGIQHISVAEDIFPSIPTFSVDIRATTIHPDFALALPCIGQPIPQLSNKHTFTAISVGNPHIVSVVDKIDINELVEQGKKVLKLKDIFPEGVNISHIECRGDKKIFVATYERGAGLTASCGTAMTSSATAMALLGFTNFGEQIQVENRGGVVYCLPQKFGDSLITRLTGNATITQSGTLTYGTDIEVLQSEDNSEQIDLYNQFLKSRK